MTNPNLRRSNAKPLLTLVEDEDEDRCRERELDQREADLLEAEHHERASSDSCP